MLGKVKGAVGKEGNLEMRWSDAVKESMVLSLDDISRAVNDATYSG